MVALYAPAKRKHEDSVMAVPLNGPLYALTSLQIGDVQSYVSRLFLLVAYEGLKLVFLVDNGPWTGNARRSRPAELWQLMVTKSRGSPFANRLRHYAAAEHGDHALDSDQRRLLKGEKTDNRLGAGQEKEDGWLSLLVALQRSCKERAQLKKPSHGLYGCVAFEVAWADVRGINYLNELQTDTCVGLEVRAMVKREFDSLEQARACYATILSGSKDLGPSLSVAKILSGKSGRRSGHDPNLPGLVPEGTRAAKERNPSIPKMNVGVKNMEDPPAGRSSGTADSQVRRRQLDETYRPSENRTGVHVTGEYGRAYFNSKNSRFTNGSDLELVGSEYFTPPSSPFSGQAFHNQNHFTPYNSRQYKDSRKSRIWPVCEAEERDSQAARKTSSEPVGPLRFDKSKTFIDRTQCASVPNKAFERNRSLGACSTCRLLREDTSTRKSQECLKCSGSSELRQEKAFIHPARLIAPAETYRDTLILFRFSEPLLPLELQRIITADQRLLKMLESGLPSWVIFLQSYPILCQLYRPWMRPLCGTIYYLISVVTVLIGFYDLYKNVPILKATAAHICGPLFEMIEDWGMISRLKYLGTMLFLQNCEKAFEWALAVVRACRQISTLVMKPVIQPLISFGETFSPVWEGVSVGVQTVVQLTSSTFSSVAVGVSSVLSILVWPIVALFSAVWYLGMAVLLPLFSAIWTIFVLPLQLVRFLASLVSALSLEVVDGFRNIGSAIYDGLQLLVATGSPALQSVKAVKSATPSPSMWRTLWNDILSKVFHAVGSIVKGLLAFFTACNRHRLSIYNHVVDFLVQVSYMLKSGQYAASSACRQIFPLPEFGKSGSSIFVDEVKPEIEAEETILYSREFSGLRHRLKGETLSAPLLFIHGDSSSPPHFQRNSCHIF